MNTESRDERIKQIRERRHAATLPSNQRGLLRTASWVDIDFLLSLLDSQAHTARELALIVDVGTSDDPGTAIKKIRKLESDAATRMRDACVEKVRAAMTHHDSRCLCVSAAHGPCDCGATRRRERLVLDIESLTLKDAQPRAVHGQAKSPIPRNRTEKQTT